MIRHTVNLLIFAGALVLGCDKAPRTTEVTPSVPASAPALPADKPSFSPEYDLRIVASESTPRKYSVKWSAKVNTGGWVLKTEQVLVEDVMGKNTARIYAILEQPGADEMVTQAIETVTGEHSTAEQPIEAAELSIKRMTRGADTTFPPLYVVVKRIP